MQIPTNGLENAVREAVTHANKGTMPMSDFAALAQVSAAISLKRIADALEKKDGSVFERVFGK